MADQRIASTEKAVGSGHATLADTLNRLTLVDHNNDGTHKEGAVIDAGAGSGQASMGGVLSINTTAVGTDADTALKTLMSYTLPANSLSANGKGVKIRAWGQTGANANGKTITIFFGSTSIAASVTAQVLNDVDWVLEGFVFRTGVSGQDGHGVFTPNAGATNESRVLAGVGNSPAEDETGTIAIAVKGTNAVAAANDIICEGMLVEFIN